MVLACLCLLVMPAAARANHHLVSIREVSAGTSAQPMAEYVELQAYSAFQNVMMGQKINFYGSSGNFLAGFSFTSNPPNGGNQRTFLMGTAQAAGLYGVAMDQTMASSPGIEADGGAACFQSNTFGVIDCVSWGNFSGSLPDPAGSPAVPGGIPDAQSLTRDISAGCATLLEMSDDTDSSNADFFLTAPTPRNNATAPTETACTGPGPGADRDPPQTTIRKRPPNRTADRTPTFRFVSDERGSRFQCKLDGRPYRACSSPFTTKRLTFGSHTLRVRAIDAAGNRDGSPAKDTFKVVRPR